MPDLGSAKLTLVVAGEKFKKGLADAKGQAEKTTKGITGAFGKAQQSIQGAAGKVPVFGGALASRWPPQRAWRRGHWPGGRWPDQDGHQNPGRGPRPGRVA